MLIINQFFAVKELFWTAVNRGNDSVAAQNETVLDKNEVATAIEYNESELMEAKLDYLQQHDTVAYEQYLLELESNRLYDSLSKAGKKPPENEIPEKAAEHAPLYGDPDYATKKEEWIKKYPDEYNAVNGSTSEADFESRQNFLESVKDTERDLYLEELERLKKSAPEFYYRHLDWLQGTDPALYRKLIKQN